jgi:adenylate kinase family enzyme
VADGPSARHDVGVERVSVVGNSGAGKSTLARRLAKQLGLVYVELDAIHHLPGWAPIDSEDFLEQVAAWARSDRWVIDGNYRAVVVDGPVWARADTVVWLDLPRRTVMRQVIGRSVRRLIRREELWNGNKESWRDVFAWDPERSIIRWSWTQHGKYCDRYSTAMASPDLSHIEFVRLRSSNDIENWLGSLRPDRSST